MKRIILMLALASPSAFAGNYATCLLDKMEGVENQAAARAAIRLCGNKHPKRMSEVEQGSGLGWLSKYKSADECIHDRARSIKVRSAVGAVVGACNRLYRPKPTGPDTQTRPHDKPYDLFDEFDIAPPSR